MRTLAEFILRGRTQATIVAVIAAALPLLFWLSAATVALVTLRKGAQTGAGLLLWAALPVLGWWMVRQDPQVMIILVMAWSMAAVLRSTVSWVNTLFSGVALAVVVSFLLPVLVPEVQKQLTTAFADAYRSISPDMVEQLGDRLDMVLGSLVAGAFAASHLLLTILSLMLARWWQSVLFNPGGFRQEFHELRMPPLYAAAALIVLLVGPMVHMGALGIAPIVLVPLMIAGFALVHGIVAKRGMGVQWLFAFYAVAIFMGPSTVFLLMVVAVIDSWFNFRGRVSKQ